MPPSFGFPALGCDGVAHLVCDSYAGCAGAEDDHSHVREFEVADVECAHYGCEGDAAGALPVVVEAKSL